MKELQLLFCTSGSVQWASKLDACDVKISFTLILHCTPSMNTGMILYCIIGGYRYGTFNKAVAHCTVLFVIPDSALGVRFKVISCFAS